VNETGRIDLGEILWARKWVILLVALVAGGATYLYYNRQPRVYQTSTSILLGTTSADDLLTGATTFTSDRDNADQAALITTPKVATLAAKRLHFTGAPEALLGSVSASPRTGSDFILISGQAGSGATAAAIANAFAQAYIENRSAGYRQEIDQSIQRAKVQAQRLKDEGASKASIKALTQRVTRLQTLEGLAQPSAEQVDKAGVPSAPIAPQPRRNAIFGFALGLVGAAFACMGLARLNRRLDRLDEVEEIFGSGVLSSMPHLRRGGQFSGPAPIVPMQGREALRRLHVHLGLLRTRHNPAEPFRVLLVASAQAGEGKSTIARNLALIQREAGCRVALVECDLRRPVQARLLGLAQQPGLSDVLDGRATLDEALQAVPSSVSASVAANGNGNGDGGALVETPDGELWALTSGSPVENPPALIAGAGLRKVLQELRERFDYVIVDSPPLLVVSDVIGLLPVVDGVVAVMRLGKTDEKAARRFVDSMSRVPSAEILGVVANDVADDELSAAGYTAYTATS
jgi:succinoglycan biosynthesis transport protein ExoP